MKVLKRTLVLFCFVAVAQALADTPSTRRTKKDETVRFGDITIKQTFDSTKEPMDPVFRMQVYDKGRLLLQMNDTFFDSFFASPNKKAFVGLSNSGWPSSAVIIFDNRGRILLLAHHGRARFDYCSETSTFIKEWYDAKDAQVRFPHFNLMEEKIAGITLRDCHGETIDLLDAVAKANEHGELPLRQEINALYGTR